MFTIYNQNTIQNVLTIVEYPLIPMKIQIFLFADDAISPIEQYINQYLRIFTPRYLLEISLEILQSDCRRTKNVVETYIYVLVH